MSSIALYVAPNTGGESFGIILAEALAGGACVVASDIPAFDDLLGHGEYGALFESESPTELAKVVIDLLRDAERESNFLFVGKYMPKNLIGKMLPKRSTRFMRCRLSEAKRFD